MLGRTLRNHYQIIKFLGQGAFGDTYLAKDLDLPGHPQCVVKHFKPKDSNPDILPIAKRLFDSEAETLYKLGKLHDQIPRLWAHFEEHGEFYLVQDFIAGQDLTKELTPGKKFSESYTITLLCDILEILAVVHQQNVIHRDIKPANIMRRHDGKIVLIDFGAVKQVSTIVVNVDGQSSSTIAIGSSGYMPSEQANRRPKLASDIHAVGMIGIQALTGQPPFKLPEDLNTGEIIWRERASVSNYLANILDKMVRDHFSQRYQNAGEALQAILSLSQPAPLPALFPPDAATLISTNPTRIDLLKASRADCVGAELAAPPEKIPKKVSSTPLKTVEFETVTVNSRGRIVKRTQCQVQVFSETLAPAIILEMVAIPEGSFVMGSPNLEAGRSNDEEPQRTVNIAPFFMGRYQVTQLQWRAVANLPKVKIDLKVYPSYFKGANLPVEQVSWHDATEFCARLSQLTGRNYKLPSEAQWEYACRAGTTTPFYFGDTITPDLVNYNGNSPYARAPKGIYRQKTTAVGSFPPNSFGLYDMHGNVWEWCQDIWHDNYDGAPTDGSAWESGGQGKKRLLRGGFWSGISGECRSAFRGVYTPDFHGNFDGFRVACAAT
ncbi:MULTISPECIES: bifunctional serine/threonine-protein kinase/formylglycine-generating enzyme family protein [unclassified Microcoleus]|uniref:bifunctional serine/threonine-protein kinase/formylglycine-generating enzyme family protein n=1 Tax=unclassified Microcoleus TaxID=2642155 RepID=UPI0025CF814F|nr:MULTISPECIES: bifunctional serine/threonine-protein kinase/formylglycine-generating enzyme family protein [unclassified Microcoleus]